MRRDALRRCRRRFAASIYPYVVLGIVAPLAVALLAIYLSEARMIDKGAEKGASGILCDEIQQIRVGVISQLGRRTIDLRVIDDLVRENSRFPDDVRWGIRLGRTIHPTPGSPGFDIRSTPVGARLYAATVPNDKEGTRYVESIAVAGGDAYVACTRIYDLTGKRFGRFRKAIYVVAWPKDRYDALRATMSFGLSYVFGFIYPLLLIGFVLLGVTVLAVQFVIFHPALRQLRQEMRAIRDGSANRLSDNHLTEFFPIVSQFNEVLGHNEKIIRSNERIIRENEIIIDENNKIIKNREAIRLTTRKLISRVVHDMNNKLQSLIDSVNAPDIDRRQMHRGIAGLTSMLASFDQQAKLEKGHGTELESSTFDLVEFVDAMLAEMRFDGKNFRKVYRLLIDGRERRRGDASNDDAAPPVMEVSCYRADLDSMLYNLVSNATKYGGGRIDVTIAAAGEEVTIDVDDDGPGIPQADRLRVFDEGTMLDPDQHLPGSGLGLDIVKTLATMAGGGVTVGESAMGGARFRLTLPIRHVEPGERTTR